MNDLSEDRFYDTWERRYQDAYAGLARRGLHQEYVDGWREGRHDLDAGREPMFLEEGDDD